MKEKLKHISRIFTGFAIGGLTFFLIFSHGSKVVQSKIFGTYLPAEAVVEDLSIAEHASICTGNRSSMSGGCSVYDAVMLEASYTVYSEDYSNSFVIEKFITDTTGRLKAADKTQAEKFLDVYEGAVGDKITIYYAEDSPEESVLNPEDEVITWFGYLILFPGMILSLGFIILGFAGLQGGTDLDFLKPQQKKDLIRDIVKNKL